MIKITEFLFKATLPVMLSFVLLACGSSPPVHYYALSPIDAVDKPEHENPVLLGLGPIRIPEYLNRKHIITRGENAEIMVDQNNRWAESLSIAIHRIVSADIDNLLDRVVVITFPYDAVVAQHIQYRMLGELSRFEANAAGQVTLEVQWGIVDRDNLLLVPIRRSRYKAQATQPGDINSIVNAMNNALSQFSRDIADQMDTALGS